MKTTIAVLDKRGNNATATVVRVLKSLHMENFEGFVIASPSTVAIEKDADALQNQNINSPIVVGYAFSKFRPNDEQQYARLEDATLVFEGKIYSPTPKMA